MLSTGRLLRATKLLCDFKTIEGTKKCSFHVYAVNNATRQRNYVFRRKQQPVAIGFVNFASSDASVEPTANAASQVLSNSILDDMKVLSELGIIPPFEEALPAPSPESKNTEKLASFDGIEMRETEEAFVPQGEVMEMNTAGMPLEVSVLEESNSSFSEPPNELVHEVIGISEVLLESMFESSVIPEVNSSPLDGSFEPIPLEQDSIRTIDQPDTSSIVLASEPTEPALEPQIEPILSNPGVEAVGTATTPTPDVTATTGGIPELTATPPELLSTVVENVGRFGGEPSLQSIGLGSWSPVGMVQQALEFIHVGLDVPWWGAIAIGTLIIRICVFPLVIMGQKNAARMNNNLPEMQAIQLKMSDARERGDKLDAARYAQELMEFMKTKGLNPLKNMVVPLCQAPFFVSMFMGIRGMASAPVESFREGGLWWFTDLTLPDQFYLLPLITSATLALTVEVGTDMGRLNSSNMGMAKYLLRAMPIIIFPFTMNFPAGVLVYWCSTNFISLFQVGILRIPAVRDYFKIARIIKFDKKALPIKEKGFVGGMKESWTNMKISRELAERERLDTSNFHRAGRGAIKKTYKFDPTQPQPPRNLSSIQLKKRD